MTCQMHTSYPTQVCGKPATYRIGPAAMCGEHALSHADFMLRKQGDSVTITRIGETVAYSGIRSGGLKP